MNHRLLTATKLVAIAAVFCTVPTATSAADQFLFPEDLPGPPAYLAEIPQDETYFTDGEWACIPVYRHIAGIRPGFNLLDFLDLEEREYAQSVPLHVHGFVIRSSPPPSPPQTQFIEDLPGMPILFVPWDVLQEAIADEELYIDELLALDGLLVGEAGMYMEQIEFPNGQAASHRRVTFGQLLDGTPFFATYNHGAADQVPMVEVRIEFGE